MKNRFISTLVLSGLSLTFFVSPTFADEVEPANLDVHALLSKPDVVAQISNLSESKKLQVNSYLLKNGIPSDINKASIQSGLRSAGVSLQYDNTGAEFLGCLTKVSLSECVTGSNDANTAISVAIGLYPNSRLDSYQDAMRHCYWNSLMSIHMSTLVALKIASNHEDFNPGTAAQSSMDYYNNAWGRYTRSLTNSGFAGRNYCKTWTDDGTLRRIQ